jgi:hypothetical protein
MPCPNAPCRNSSHLHNRYSRRSQFQFSNFAFPVYDRRMAEHIEDIQHRYVDLKKRMELVRSYL